MFLAAQDSFLDIFVKLRKYKSALEISALGEYTRSFQKFLFW